MKTKPIFLLVALSIIGYACSSDRTRSFIPGMYVNHSHGTFSVADDTLVIHPAESNHFVLSRMTGFNRIQDDSTGKREYETETWNTIYDQSSQTLTETRRGKVILFDPEKGLLIIGKRVYTKINN